MTKRKRRPSGHCWQSIADSLGNTIAGMHVARFNEHTTPSGGRNDTATGYCVNCPLIPRRVAVRELRRLRDAGNVIPCQHCQQASKPQTTTVATPTRVRTTMGGKVSDKTLLAYSQLQPDQREAVDEILSAHRRACASVGCGTENPDRMMIEAMEIAAMEARTPTVFVSDAPNEPRRQYDAYVAPKEL